MARISEKALTCPPPATPSHPEEWKLKSMSTPRLRYAFAITQGPNAGLGCGGWRIWTHGEDTYIAAKGNPWKASLHSDASWRVAVTSEHVTSGKLPIVPGGRATSWEFEPTRFEHGGRMAFAIAVPRNSLIPITLSPVDDG